MNAKSIGNGIYKDEEGRFWIRPFIDGNRTWRKLRSTTAKQAKEEGGEILRAQRLHTIGAAKDPFAKFRTIGEVIEEYISSRAAGRRRKLSESRWTGLGFALRPIKEWFGNIPLDSLRRHHLDGYFQFRRRKQASPTMVDWELSALSSIVTWCVDRGYCEVNYMLGRQRFSSSTSRIHCRERMPKDGDELHAVAEKFFANPWTEVYGWQLLFQALTGCRTSEAVIMQTDAPHGEPGHVEADRLDIHRSKSGVRPWVIIHPDLREFMISHRAWLGDRSKWWFPSQKDPANHIQRGNLNIQLWRLHKRGGCQPLRSHGMRAYFVTKMRRDGLSDSDVATLIGDKTVSLIHEAYGAPRPGEPLLSFRRSDGTASWERWLPKADVIQFPASLRPLIRNGLIGRRRRFSAGKPTL